MTSTERMQHRLLVLSGDKCSKRRQLKQGTAIWTRSRRNGKAVCLDDDQAKPGPEVCWTNWRDVLPYDVFQKLWQQAYSVVDGALKGGGLGTTAAWPFFHGIAEQLHRFLVMRAIAEQADTPVLFVWSGCPVQAAKALGIAALIRSPAGYGARRRVAQAARVGRHLASRIRMSLAPGDPAAETSDRGPAALTYVVVAEDGVSGVNSVTTVAVFRELVRRGRSALVLTQTPDLAKSLADSGYDCRLIDAAAVRPSISLMRQLIGGIRASRRLLRRVGDEGVGHFLSLYLRTRWPMYVAVQSAVDASLDHLHRGGGVGAVLVVNESTTTGLAAIAWARRHNVMAVGSWPALIGDRPDCKSFPAARHLAYGEQSADLMRRCGVPAGQIIVVGSPNFDEVSGRERSIAGAAFRAQFAPDWDPKRKLIAVASEALPRPFEELGPVLMDLARRPDIDVVLKLHPADAPELFRDFLSAHDLCGRVRLIENCDIDELLAAAYLLISVLSNVIVKAAILHTPTLVCDFSNKRAPLDFVAEGLCVGCFDPSQLSAAIDDMIEGGPLYAEAMRRLSTGISRFTGPNDGHSARRIANELIAASGQKVVTGTISASAA